MKKVQRFIGVGDSKPASAPLATGSSSTYQESAVPSSAPPAPSTPGAPSTSYDAAVQRLLAPSQSGQQQQQQQQQQQRYGSRQVSPQTSQNFLNPALASPQPHSPSAQHHYFDLPVRAVSPGAGALAAMSPRPVSPLVQAPSQPTASTSAAHLVERPDLHKYLKALESLLVNLDEYRDLSARLAKVEKKLAKSTSDLEKTKVVLDTPSQTLQVSSTMFEGLAEVSSRHAKHVQKEYEAVNDACAKYFKKVAKEERAHDELVQALDAKIKKANAAHEKNVKKVTGNKALESHDKYIAAVQTLTNEISRAKNSHAQSMAAKSHVSSLMVASTIGGLADVEFKMRCESVRRVGLHVGRLNELLCFASSEYMPALQASEFEEVEQGQAEYLAGLAAQVEAQVVAQAQINAKVNEDTQTILRAQEMGWRPPSPLAPPSASFANLGHTVSIDSNKSRSNDPAGSSRQSIEPVASYSNLAASSSSSSNNIAPTPAATPSASRIASASLQQSERQGARSRSNSTNVPQASNAAASLSTQRANGNDAESVHNAASDQTPRPANGTFQSGTSSALLGAANTSSALLGSARLDRSPTGSTLKSMAAQPETWDQASVASAHDRDRTASSNQEGSVVDKLAVPREDSGAATPSLSATNSAQGSEDGNRIPRTPDESESMPSMQGSRVSNAKPPQQSSSKDAGILDDRNALPSSNSVVRPAQRALEQYREQSSRVITSPITEGFETRDYAGDHRPLNRSDSIYSATSQQSGATEPLSAEQANARKVSLWERERERMRQLEREEEQSRSSELRYSRPASAIYSSSTATSSYSNGGCSRSKTSEAGSQLGLGYPRSSNGQEGAAVHDVDRYAPAVGSTRLSAVGVTRSLSTDTTASERSFVQRMKARYQAEKDLEREQRELNVLEKERAARRATMDPNLIGAGRSRVPEIASRYQMPGAGTYGQEVMPGRRYHDSLPAGSPSGGISRMSLNSSSPSAASGSIDEFGGIVRGGAPRNTVPAGGRGAEAPHSDVCGCQKCSARHYGNGRTQGPNEKNVRPSAGTPREYNVRRTSMPVPPRGASTNDAQLQQQYGRTQQPAYGSSPTRESHGYRQPTAGREAGVPRPAYDEMRTSSDAGPRRVAFSNEPQTIR